MLGVGVVDVHVSSWATYYVELQSKKSYFLKELIIE